MTQNIIMNIYLRNYKFIRVIFLNDSLISYENVYLNLNKGITAKNDYQIQIINTKIY